MSRTAIIAGLAACLVVVAIAAVTLGGRGLTSGGLLGTTGKALIGGPFELVDHEGKTVTDEDFRGKPMLIFFGFTHCPDICPATLQVISTALDNLGDDARKVQPLMITIDPERDTPELLAAYVDSFYPTLRGLTGTPEQVSRALKAYRVYARKNYVDETKTDYAMDHSSFFYLMGADGQFITHFTHGISVDKLTDALRKRLSG